MAYDINGEQLPYRKIITIDGSKVTTETGIPLELNIVLSGVKSDGSDVRLAYLNGTPIAREIECVGVPSTDVVMIHYPFDTIAGTNSQFYVYWGNPDLTEPAADSTYGSQAVWDTNHVGVWHLNQEPNGAGAGAILDSTANNRNMSPQGFSADSLVNSEYEKGIDLDGAAEYFDVSNVDNAFDFGTGDFIELVVANYDILSGDSTIFTTGYSSAGGMNWRITSDGNFDVDMEGSTIFNGVGSGEIITESRKIISIHRTGGNLYGYVDGAQIGTVANSINIDSAQSTARLGTALLFSGDFADGVYSEYRVLNGGVSTNYIITTHKNLNNPTAGGTDPFYLADGIVEYQRRHPQYQN